MKLEILVTEVKVSRVYLSGAKTYTIIGGWYGELFSIGISESQWKALCKAHGKPLTVDSKITVQLPGEWKEEEEG